MLSDISGVIVVIGFDLDDVISICSILLCLMIVKKVWVNVVLLNFLASCYVKGILNVGILFDNCLRS